MWVLHITRPDGTQTALAPVRYAAQCALAVAALMASAAPWLTERERRRIGLEVARADKEYVHAATGYRFRIDKES